MESSFARRAGAAHPAPAAVFRIAVGLALALGPGLAGRPAAAALRAQNARPALAAESADPVLQLPGGLTLHAGERCELRWSAPDGAVDELEILLSIDGGRRFALRVSPELDARAGRYVWRVPNLASADARLKLRFSRDGREIDGPVSAPFTLVARSGAAGYGARTLDKADARAIDEALRPASDAEPGAEDEPAASSEPDVDLDPVHEGIWWTGMRALDAPLAAGALSDGPDRISAARELPAAGPLPDAPATLRPLGESGPRPAFHAASHTPLPQRAPARHYPLRN